MFDSNGTLLLDTFAFEPSFTGGVRVATADVTGDGVDDMIVGAGPGGGPRIKVLDGVTGQVVRDFFSFESNFTGGVFVAGGDVTGDGFADIAVAAGSTGSPRVVVIDGVTGQVVRNFFAYDERFRGGARVAVGDVNGDGFADIVTTPGPSGGPQVRGFDGRTGIDLFSFFGVEEDYRGGLFVSVAPSVAPGLPGAIVVGRDGFPNFQGSVFDAIGTVTGGLAATQAAGPTTVGLFGYAPTQPGGVTPFAVTTAYPDTFLAGVRVAARTLPTGEFRTATAPGPGGDSLIRVLQSVNGEFIEVSRFTAFEPEFTGSVYVG
jgi:hypothetical protein